MILCHSAASRKIYHLNVFSANDDNACGSTLTMTSSNNDSFSQGDQEEKMSFCIFGSLLITCIREQHSLLH